MRKRVAGIARDLAARLASWPGITGVVLGEITAADVTDPYFSIDMAAYHDGSLPPAEIRKERLGSPTGFTFLPHQGADQFLVDDLPVRVFYRTRERLDMLLERTEQGRWVFRKESMSILYRIQTGDALYDKDGWLERARQRIACAPESLWNRIQEGSRIALERALADMGAAVYRDDPLFFQLAAARFLQNLCTFLFASNKQFEPVQELLLERILRLPRLPDEFPGRFRSLIRMDGELTPARRYEICQLVAKSLAPL